jgi:very-short-patch-repair endonuclease
MYQTNQFVSIVSFILEDPLTKYARQLRKNQTEAEKFLWKLLRGRKFHGYKFRRQHPIEKQFILDFYCLERNLAIEVDGYFHHEKIQKQLDDERTKILSSYGIRVVRFTNWQVLNHIDDVLKKILDVLQDQ